MEAKPGAVQDHVQSHIEMIADHEQDFLESRTRLDRAGDAVGAFAMGLRFVGLHLAAFAAWVLVNTARIGGIAQFDPYPFRCWGRLSIEALSQRTSIDEVAQTIRETLSGIKAFSLILWSAEIHSTGLFFQEKPHATLLTALHL